MPRVSKKAEPNKIIQERRKSKSLLFNLILIAIVLSPLEIFSYIMAKHFLAPRGLVYDAPVPTEEEFANYLQTRHPVLGWPSPQNYGVEEMDKIGSRVNPYFPDTSEIPCVSVYGDSFSWSEEVNAASAWPAQLSKLLNCRVNNFGVGGFGTDQALIRLYGNKTDQPEVLIMGFFSENIMRNVNQFRGLLSSSPKEQFGFKPRFIVENDQLQVVNLLDFTNIAYKDVYLNPNQYLAYDYFLPGEDTQVPSLRFPYSVTVIKAISSKKFKTSYLENESKPFYYSLYEDNHPSDALKVTKKILLAFNAESSKRNSQSLIILIPSASDLFLYESSKQWPYQNLIMYLEQWNLDYLNMGEEIYSLLKKSDRQLCYFYWEVPGTRFNCGGHFNEAGYKVVADAVYKKLQSLQQ